MEFTYAEGATPLDPDEAHDLIPTHITTSDQLNEWEQANILQGETWLFQRKRPELLREPFLRELHRKMFDLTWRWAGQYRKTAKNIGVPFSQIGARIKDACDNAAFQVANEVFDLDETAVRLHHNLVSIHPFPNGNGRHTRLVADALLFQNDRERFSWGSANLQIAGDARATYLSALRSADKGDYAGLIRFARG